MSMNSFLTLGNQFLNDREEEKVVWKSGKVEFSQLNPTTQSNKQETRQKHWICGNLKFLV